MQIIFSIILFVLLIYLWRIVLKYLINPSLNSLSNITGLNKIFPNNNSQKASESLLSNLDFKKEVNKIILNEGGVESFIEKTKITTEFDPYNVMVMGYKIFSEKSSEIALSKTAEVVDSLMKTNAIKETILKFNLSKNEIGTLANGLFIGICDKDFKKIALQINNEVNEIS
jgi:hypothetical protein